MRRRPADRTDPARHQSMFRAGIVNDLDVRDSRLVGAQSLAVITLAAGWWVFALVLFNPARHWDSTNPPLAAAALFGVGMGVMLLLATARAFVRGDRLYLVSFLWTQEVPMREIIGVVDDNGFAAKLVSGRTVGSMAFGSSLVAMVTGNRRGRRAGRRLLALHGPFATANVSWHQDDTRTRIRFEMISLAVTIVGLMVGYSTLASWN